MGTIKSLLEKVNRLDARSQAPVIIENTSNEIIELNQSQLYLEGINSNGDQLRPYQSENYARYKNRINPNPGLGRPDLNLTGAFYSDFTVKVSEKEFTIDSINQKTGDLTDKYGNAIFGFTTESRSFYAKEIFFRNLKLYIENVTGLNFAR